MYLEDNPDFKVGFFVFKRELDRFELTIYIPKKDKCIKCEELQQIIKEEPDNMESDEYEMES